MKEFWTLMVGMVVQPRERINAIGSYGNSTVIFSGETSILFSMVSQPFYTSLPLISV
jgi:hypothetical protein